MGIFSKLFGDANKRTLDSLQPVIDKINELEPTFESFSLEELKSKTEEFKKRIADGESLDDILPEAFALVRESAKRTLGQRHFDVQLMGGITLHQGKISEMKTGEGKTLVATLPAYLNALSGKGVHIVTVNDYLSRRDTAWMGQVYDALGLTVGSINHEASYLYDSAHVSKKEEDELDKERDTTGGFKVVHEFLRPVERREAYEADITFGTNNEFGFDYLRDNMVYDQNRMAQAKGHNFVIVDEIDSILIDEARTPLIISAPDTDSTSLYQTFAKIVPQLKENVDYNVDEKLKAVSITEEGIEKVEKILNLKNIYEEGGTRYVHHLEQALKANVIFHRDTDYVVREGEVIIVDEFTGRLMPGRRWSEGLHQAVEAKEGVYVQKESRTLATITFQNYFRLYDKISGMTGTAQTSAEEFHKVYKLDVVSIPTNKPLARLDMPDRIYKTEGGKLKALIQEVKERHTKGQPVLIGTVSITKNEMLSTYLEREGIPHRVLNAKNHENEGEIIAQAGRVGGVTVATNMAGRGVDIMLGGNPPEPEEAKKVKDLGGLLVIGTERHEARRIDNQLRGRAGRQGDPGSSQFFVSTEDELVRIFGGDRLKNLMDRLGVGEDDVIENNLISKAIEQAQSKIEGNNFDVRKYVLEYDDVMNRHRTSIYDLRKETLRSENIRDKILGYVHHELDKIVNFHTGVEVPDWNVEEISEHIKAIVPVEDAGFHSKVAEVASARDAGQLIDFLHEVTDKAYEAKEKQVGLEPMRHLEKMVLLRVIDELWVDHLEQMESLRDSVRLRAYGQRDPLIEYKIEGQKMFNQLQAAIGQQISNMIFKVGFVNQPKETKIETKRANIVGSNASSGVSKQMEEESKRDTVVNEGPKVGRNDPCPCGAVNPTTGQVYKFKKCGMIDAPHHKK
ncbi:MAG: preprotein translocase subunit SecA [Candidatus Paceibacterota bacterium]